MIKRDITETVYEYDKEGKLLKKTVTETHEEEDNTTVTYPSFTYLNGGGTTNPCVATLSTTKDCIDGLTSLSSDKIMGTVMG